MSDSYRCCCPTDTFVSGIPIPTAGGVKAAQGSIAARNQVPYPYIYLLSICALFYVGFYFVYIISLFEIRRLYFPLLTLFDLLCFLLIAY